MDHHADSVEAEQPTVGSSGNYYAQSFEGRSPTVVADVLHSQDTEIRLQERKDAEEETDNVVVKLASRKSAPPANTSLSELPLHRESPSLFYPPAPPESCDCYGLPVRTSRKALRSYSASPQSRHLFHTRFTRPITFRQEDLSVAGKSESSWGRLLTGERKEERRLRFRDRGSVDNAQDGEDRGGRGEGEGQDGEWDGMTVSDADGGSPGCGWTLNEVVGEAVGLHNVGVTGKALDRVKTWIRQLRKLTRQMRAAEEMSLDLDLVDSSFSSDFLELVKSANSALKGLPNNIKQQMIAKKERLLHRSERVWRRLQNAKTKRLLHKMCFLVVLFDVIVSSFWVGRWPGTYYVWHSTKYATLMVIRFIVFRLNNWHYYLFDFCYYANALLLLFLWVKPQSASLWRMIFGFNGILSVSVYFFRDSLVPHSLQRVTSAVNHSSPLVVMWTLRWFTVDTGACEEGMMCIPECAGYLECFLDGFVESLGAYLCWGLLYYTKMFVVSSLRIEERNYATLYKYVAIEQG
eukprot:GHVQ01022452.1.p1 GENE.GHVQ01022452.1~~GHVQ01022452.1.p1  ORF type:complete len:520 (-),score=64.67 GHVQ01022452.1:1688-3247(-)